MYLPVNVLAIVRRFAARYPVPQMPDGAGPADGAFENVCRAWILHLAQQIRFSTADPRWGTKQAAATRPQSKDSIANDGTDDRLGTTGGLQPGVLLNFDLLTGVGTGHPTLVAQPESLDITNPPDGPQVFIAVEPIDYLGDVPPPTTPPTSDLAARVAALEAEVAALMVTVAHQSQDLAAERTARMAADESLQAAIAGVPSGGGMVDGYPVYATGGMSLSDVVRGRAVTWIGATGAPPKK